MRRLVIIAAVSSAIFLIGLAVWTPATVAQARWLRKTAVELHACGPPPPEARASLAPGRWANERYLIFSNDWASFAYNTFHDSERLGDIALLRGADGSLYVSHYHFCTGLPDPPNAPRPANLADFLRLNEAKQKWIRQPRD